MKINVEKLKMVLESMVHCKIGEGHCGDCIMVNNCRAVIDPYDEEMDIDSMLEFIEEKTGDNLNCKSVQKRLKIQRSEVD